jgi:hypothetical protein
MILNAHGTQAAQVWSKSVSNKGHFTLEAETVSAPYIDWHCCGVIETPHRAIPALGLQAEEVWSTSVSKKGHFTLEAETAFHPFLSSHCSRVTET